MRDALLILTGVSIGIAGTVSVVVYLATKWDMLTPPDYDDMDYAYREAAQDG